MWLGVSKEQRLTAALLEASPDLLAYFRRRVALQDAPDLLGEVFVTAWRCVKDVPVSSEQARMWLFGVAHGALRNYQRGDRRRWALADRIRDHVSIKQAPAADTGIEIRDAISRLPSDLAEIVTLVHWEGMSLAEAAQIVGVPASTARGRYQRAQDVLREALSVSTAPISTKADS